jgi:uncharacterized protein
VALLGPTAVLVASYAAVTLLGGVSWRFEPDAAINLAINVVIVSFFAFFEEIGWRGYMLPKLATRYPRMAPAIVGFFHGVWHLPLMVLTTSYNPAGNRLIVVPLFLAILTVAGILYGYLRNASGSLWPVVIAHGVQRGPRGAGRSSGGRKPNDRRIPHRRDWRVHSYRADHLGVGAGQASGHAQGR